MIRSSKSNQAGFSATLIIAILLIGVVIGGTGFVVFKKTSNTKSAHPSVTNPAPSQGQSTKETDKQTPKLKPYSNDKYGFSFQYPESWTLTEDLKDIGRGKVEGDIVVASPDGTKVHFSPNLGGKGGDCIDPQTNTYSKRTCSTRDILHLETLSSSGTSQPIYFYHAKLTDSELAGGKTKYYIDIENRGQPLTQGPVTGVFIYPYDEINLLPGHETYYLTVYVEGRNDSINNSPGFFDTTEVKEATPILKSFRLLE